MSDERMHELFDGYLEGRLTAGELAELEDGLLLSRDLCRQFWEYTQQHALLSEVMREARGRETAVCDVLFPLEHPRVDAAGEIRESKGTRPFFLSCLPSPVLRMAACLALVAGAWFFFREPAELARLVAEQPDVVIERNQRVMAQKGGLSLQAGDMVKVGPGGHALIRYADGTRLELGAHTCLILQPEGSETKKGKHLRLDRGALLATVSKQPAGHPLVIVTPTARAQVLGTQFQLSVKERSTRLNVNQGLVRFERLADGRDREISQGEQAVITDNVSAPLSVARVDGPAFHEDFEDADLGSKGWYDAVTQVISDREHRPGGNFAAEFPFLKNRREPAIGFAVRRRISACSSIHLSYWVKRDPGWPSGLASEVRLLTTKNSDWQGTGYTCLTVTLGVQDGRPAFLIQDGQNLDVSRLGQDLVNVTEYRAVAGGNGDSDGHGEGDWYFTEGAEDAYTNRKSWLAEERYVRDERGPFYKGDWHHVEAMIELNSISGGKAVPDGKLKYWYDGKLVIDHEDVVLRTGAHADMKFNQFLIAPYVYEGSSSGQTLWLDDLDVICGSKPGE